MSNPGYGAETEGLHVVIVGGVAGGMSCAARLRRLHERARITVFERGPHVSFANCGLPYFIGGEIASRDKLVVQTPERLNANFNLDIRVRTEVTGIDRKRRRVSWRNADTGEVGEAGYDALVLSPGASPLLFPFPGHGAPGQFTVRNIPDIERVDAWIREHDAKRAVVIGGGYIGLEMAEQLVERGLQVSVAEAAPQVMAPLDEEMAEMLHDELRAHGVDLHLSDALERIDTGGGAAGTVVLKSGAKLPADVVILGLGVKPDSDLASDADLEMGPRGTIQVDENMRTSDPRIYAVGDAVEVRDVVTGRNGMVPLAGPANRQGRIAADAIMGRAGSRYRGTLGTAVLRLFGLSAACTGANARTLRSMEMRHEVLYLHPGSHAGYFPGAHPIALKVIYDPETGRLLGGQAVGRDGVDKRIDVLATAIHGGLNVEDLADLELAYAPPFNSARDPLNQAGMMARNLREGLVKQVLPQDLKKLAPGTVVLDVRNADERQRDPGIPGSVHIPLGELRGRIKELDRAKPHVVHCVSGQRSYVACRLLSQHGFDCSNLAGALKTWKLIR